MPKKYSHCIFLSVIVTDSVYKKTKNYYPEAFLEELKYEVKEEKMTRFTTEDIEISSSNNGDDDSEEDS